MLRTRLLRLAALWLAATFALAAAAAPRTVTILETSDLHGHLLPWDYARGEPADYGLAAVAALVADERRRDPDLLLLDAGDTIQGSPLVYFYAMKRPHDPHPMAVVMNAMHYDAMAIGNHEYNFGQPTLDRFIRDASFPVLCANIRRADGTPRYTPHLVRDVHGVRVGIFALTTPGILVWEKPRHLAGLQFADLFETARRSLAELRAAGATVIVALCHSGLGEPPAAGSPPPTDPARQPHNFCRQLAGTVPGIDLILAAHSHQAVEGADANGTLIIQPSFWGRAVARAVITVDEAGRAVAARGSLLHARASHTDPDITALARPFHEAVTACTTQVVAQAAEPFPDGPGARAADGPLADFLAAAQTEMAARAGHRAEVSIVSIFANAGGFRAGPVTVGDIQTAYPYENTLAVLRLRVADLRAAMERSAAYWRQVENGLPASLSEAVAGDARAYNWDLYTGIDYTIDLRQPVGRRVARLRREGRELADTDTLTVAVNNYRAGGGGGYEMFRRGDALWESQELIKDFLVDYARERGTLKPGDFFVRNWSLLPAGIEALNP